jgi:hypothetical protein
MLEIRIPESVYEGSLSKQLRVSSQKSKPFIIYEEISTSFSISVTNRLITNLQKNINSKRKSEDHHQRGI